MFVAAAISVTGGSPTNPPTIK